MRVIPFDVDQAGWNSTEIYPDGVKGPWNPDKWVIHYGGGSNKAGDNQDDDIAIEVLQSWQRWHIRGRGWQDIAYNYAISQAGTVFRLRGENRAGATRGDFDRDGIPENHEGRAVVFILGGNQVPTEEAYAAFREMWQADPLPVIGHQQVYQEGSRGTPTACPGSALMEWIGNGGYADSVEEGNMEKQFTDEEAAALKEMVRQMKEEVDPPSNPGYVAEAIKLIRRERSLPLHARSEEDCECVVEVFVNGVKQ